MDDDGALIERYLEGDSPAFDEIVRRHSAPLFWFILRRTRNRELAEDVLQETFLRMLNHLDTYSHRGKLRSWLFRIAHNRIVDEARRRGNAVVLPLDAAPESEDGSGRSFAESLAGPGRHDPAFAAETSEAARAARDGLARLPAAQREVFLLRQSGIPFKDIARYQGCSINTSLGRMHDAVNALRRMLEDEP